ncbi:hypothetical protein KBI33_03280 [Candidatus Shapirobacteria bacterium]|nr:hypothetical protein [Candidatus Shapirobacteria bacterium]
MTTLTERQIAILKAVVEEYIETARPVSSDRLEKKYRLGISPATIRNEMSDLAEAGYLQKSHISSGRAPTSLGMKFYVRNLLKPQEVSVKDEAGIKERIWPHREERERLVREATMELARRSGVLSLTIGPDEEFYLAGLANILNFPEFWDIDLTQSLLSILDNYSFWRDLINKEGEEMPVYVLLGEDLGGDHLSSCGFIFSRFRWQGRDYAIGVLGPCRLQYSRVIPLVNFFGHLLSEISF